MKKRLSFSLLLFLTGCSLFPDEKEPLPLYILESGVIKPSSVLKAPLLIECPRSEASLDTHRIAVTLPHHRRDYMANAQWPETLPKIVHQSLMEGFSTRWGEAFINCTGEGLGNAYGLYATIQDFSIFPKQDDSADIYIKISFKLIDLHKRRPLAGRTFLEKVSLKAPTVHNTIEGFNKGFHDLLYKVILWIEDII